jgi:release factor glutamine methyltransferase
MPVSKTSRKPPINALHAVTERKTIAELLRAATARLLASRTYSPRLDAEVLLRYVLGIDRTALFARLQDPVEFSDRLEFERLIEKRFEGCPVAYLIGEREFMGIPFIVNPSVLVPRPGTEQLVEWAEQWLIFRPDAKVVDVGTGSGAIILSLAKFAKSWTGRAIGIDLSEAAIEVAQTNRSRLGLQDRVELVAGDLLVPVTEPVDLILANLPYLTPDQIMENPELAAEPRMALEGGPDGLDEVRRLLNDIPRALKPAGAAVLELNPGHVAEVARIASASLPKARVLIERDLEERDRFVIVERDNKEG